MNKQILTTVSGIFPNLKSEIEAHFFKSETFREICEDYVLCSNTIQKMLSDDSTSRRTNLKKYKCALKDLERELLKNLEGSNEDNRRQTIL